MFSFDYVLLLGVLLAAADLAFVEVQFTPLGSSWPWHLLIVSLFMAYAAIRFDSRSLFSLALSTFAAWRGVSVSFSEPALWWTRVESVRWNAILCGLVFIGLGSYAKRSGRKPHFQPVSLHLGWLLVLGALISGGSLPEYLFYSSNHPAAAAYIVLLLLTCAGLAWFSFKRRRFMLFLYAVFGIYIGLCQLVLLQSRDPKVIVFCTGAGAVLLLAGLWKAQRKMKETS